ncbi:ABC transporter ATP-binding protein [Desulfogranum japonicum]|uniref:ABC transporter ATP-binding protein n=1 Tax=Desulfogranum japonicum TaxID=231447 RepID=UPI0003FB84DD|nr:ABC transporter ATP-binding protein [Desulfogranum japonicum]
MQDVSFGFNQGEICCLLGLNGAGKTTLIKILAGLLEPDSGDARILGRDIRTHDRLIRQSVGLVNTNERSFYWRLSVRKNLLFFASLYGLQGKNASVRVDNVLSLVGLADLGKQRFDRCSSGQKQKVSLARALLASPKILLLDEPTSNIDIVAARKLRNLIRTRLVNSERMAALWCTHNLHEAQEVCDRVVILHQGRILADLSKQDLIGMGDTISIFQLEVIGYRPGILTMPKGEEQPVCIEENNRQIIRLQCAEKDIPRFLQQLVENRVQVYGCTSKVLHLEDFFERITEKEGESCCTRH